MFMTGVIYKILEVTVSRCQDPAFCSPILQVLLSGIFAYLYHAQTVFFCDWKVYVSLFASHAVLQGFKGHSGSRVT